MVPGEEWRADKEAKFWKRSNRGPNKETKHRHWIEGVPREEWRADKETKFWQRRGPNKETKFGHGQGEERHDDTVGTPAERWLDSDNNNVDNDKHFFLIPIRIKHGFEKI